jgi:hypothetical protein
MAAEDFVRGGRGFSDEVLDASFAESPARPTMEAADHFNRDQFADVMVESLKPPAARHPHFIGGKSVYQYRTSPGSAH